MWTKTTKSTALENVDIVLLNTAFSGAMHKICIPSSPMNQASHSESHSSLMKHEHVHLCRLPLPPSQFPLHVSIARAPHALRIRMFYRAANISPCTHTERNRVISAGNILLTEKGFEVHAYEWREGETAHRRIYLKRGGEAAETNVNRKWYCCCSRMHRLNSNTHTHRRTQRHSNSIRIVCGSTYPESCERWNCLYRR